VLIDFVQNLFPKFKHFDWVIAKLVLLLANQNVQFGNQFWGNYVLQNQFKADDSALSL